MLKLHARIIEFSRSVPVRGIIGIGPSCSFFSHRRVVARHISALLAAMISKSLTERNHGTTCNYIPDVYVYVCNNGRGKWFASSGTRYFKITSQLVVYTIDYYLRFVRSFLLN